MSGARTTGGQRSGGDGAGRGRAAGGRSAGSRFAGQQSFGNRSSARSGPTGEPGEPDESLGDPQAVARAVCLRLLDQRARTRAELAEALRRRGVPDEPAAVVLDRFTEIGLIDDASLADAMAQGQHRDRGLARRAVAAKLRRRGVGDEHIASALTQIDSDSERVRAAELVQRRLRALTGLPVEVQQRRLVGLLGRKGYPLGLAFEVVRTELRAAGTTDLDSADEG